MQQWGDSYVCILKVLGRTLGQEELDDHDDPDLAFFRTFSSSSSCISSHWRWCWGSGLRVAMEATEDMLLCGVLFTEKGVCFPC